VGLAHDSNSASGRIGSIEREEHRHFEACPSLTAAFAILGKRWNALILDLLASRPARFSEIHRAVPGLSDKVLGERLAELVAAGLVERRIEDDRAVYSLTAAGTKLAPALNQIRGWADETLLVIGR
jgi:DNA-binding HxlR family transcriptional regulator